MPSRVLVTRAPHQASELAEQLRAHGLEPILIPAIELTDPTSFATLDAALKRLTAQGQPGFHWLIFTSANAVQAFAKRSLALKGNTALSEPRGGSSGLQAAESSNTGKGALALEISHEGLNIAAIGPSTARALRELNLEPTLIPPQAVAESLTEALLPHALQPDGSPTRFLLIRAEEAREHLPESLRAAGAEVTIVPAYRTIIPTGSIEAIRQLLQPQDRVAHPLTASSSKGGVPSSMPPPASIDAITFTSSSTARNLLALCEAASVALPESALRISIGPITTQTLRDLGYPPHAEAPEATVASLAETVVKALNSQVLS